MGDTKGGSSVSADKDLNPYEQNIVYNVREYGCHINFVTDPENLEPSFGYSVGFPETSGQPEVIVFGLSSDLTQYAVNATLDQCREGLNLEEETRIEQVLEGHAFVIRKVLAENIVIDYFNSAMWYHRLRTGASLDHAVQLVWPSAGTDLYPWDRDCPAEVRAAQPALYETEIR